jgi:Chromosome segregation ATPases
MSIKESEHSRFKAETEKKIRELENNCSVLADLQKGCRDLGFSLEESKRNTSLLRQELETKSQDLVQLEEENRIFKQDLTSKQLEIKALNSQLVELNARLRTELQCYNILEEEKRKILTEMESKTLEIERLKEELKKSKEFEQKYLKERSFPNTFDPFQFYDGVIEVNSLLTLKQGWPIFIRDHNDYIAELNNERIILGILGKYGKGKTYLLELLNGAQNPSGFKLPNPGISFKQIINKQDKLSNVIALEPRGSSFPLKNCGYNCSKSEELTQEQVISDHLITEQIIQNFIIEVSDVIVIVTSLLMYEDQILIQDIQNRLEKMSKKSLIVVHNLSNFSYISEAQMYIESVFQSSFNLKGMHYTFATENNSNYYQQPNLNIKISHLILAKHGTEAGEYYNRSTVEYIRQYLYAFPPAPVNLIEKFETFLQKVFPTYIKEDQQNSSLQVEKSDSGLPLRILYQGPNQIKLKSISPHEVAIATDSFRPPYCLKIQDNRYLVLEIECPGKKHKVSYKIEEDNQSFRILVRGEKFSNETDVNGLLVDMRKNGIYHFATSSIDKKLININKKKYERVDGDGMIIMKWELDMNIHQDKWN